MKRAFFYFTITAIFWGLNFHLAKIMLREVGFIEAGFWRYLFGVIPLLALVYRKWPPLSSILRNLKGLVLVGVVCLFGFNFFFFLGMTKSPAINGALIVSLTPAITLLFSNQILKTQLRTRQMVGVLISFLGVLYLILKGNLADLSNIEFSLGDILLLIAATFFALQNVWVKKYAGNFSNLDFTFLTNLFCMLSFLLVLPFIDRGGASTTQFSSSFWLAAVGIGCFGTSITYYLWNKGIQLTSANQAGIFINVVPMAAAIFSVVFGEVLHGYHMISGVFIIVGVIIMMVKTKKGRDDEHVMM